MGAEEGKKSAFFWTTTPSAPHRSRTVFFLGLGSPRFGPSIQWKKRSFSKRRPMWAETAQDTNKKWNSLRNVRRIRPLFSNTAPSRRIETFAEGLSTVRRSPVGRWHPLVSILHCDGIVTAPHKQTVVSVLKRANAKRRAHPTLVGSTRRAVSLLFARGKPRSEVICVC